MQEVLAGEEKVTSGTRRACLPPRARSLVSGDQSVQNPQGEVLPGGQLGMLRAKTRGMGADQPATQAQHPIRRKNNFTWLGVPQGQDSRGSREWKSKRRPHNGSSPSAGLFTSK